jgi:hypothetical protein
MKGGERAPPPSAAQANFTLMTECTPESRRDYSVYSVVKTKAPNLLHLSPFCFIYWLHVQFSIFLIKNNYVHLHIYILYNNNKYINLDKGVVLQPPWGLHGAPVDWGREETGHAAVQVVTAAAAAAANQISGRRRFGGPRPRYQRLRHRLVFCWGGPAVRGAGRLEQIVVAVRQPVSGRRRGYSTAARE